MMVALWFILTCAMFAAYVVLDGYDLGAGIVAPFVAKRDAERRVVLHSILPFWDGNEVFLVAGGATLYLAFPRLFPALISGFYLPVMMVLWLLALRGLSIEMRHKLDHPLWNQLWDGGFFFSSLVLVVFFGAALGNVVRGVSIDERGDFFAPLWTTFGVGDKVGILDWYTVLVGLTAVILIARHGALRLAREETEGATPEVRAVSERAHLLAARLVIPSAVLVVSATAATFHVQPNALHAIATRPWTAIFGVAGVVAFVDSALSARRGHLTRAFYASSVVLAGLFACACVAVYPYGLLARSPAQSILASDVAADPYALGVGLAWWLPGMTAVALYSVFAHRRLVRATHH